MELLALSGLLIAQPEGYFYKNHANWLEHQAAYLLLTKIWLW